MQKLKRIKIYIGMHKPLDLLLLLGHHNFNEMDFGYKETLLFTSLYISLEFTSHSKLTKLYFINIHHYEAVYQYFSTLKL